MLLATYISTRPGIQGLANRLIRLRLFGQASHSEVVFEPGDGVDDLMPDGSCQPLADGSLWCASSVAWELLPMWSKRRPGRHGGVRFKRVVLEPGKWRTQPYRRNPVRAARWFVRNEGHKYSWQLILRTAAWVIALFSSLEARQVVCSQACAEAGDYPDAWRFDPCALEAAVAAENAAARAGC